MEAIKRAGSLDGERMRDAILKTRLPHRLRRFKVDADGFQVAHKMVLFQWQDGKKVIVWPEELAPGRPRFPTPPWKSGISLHNVKGRDLNETSQVYRRGRRSARRRRSQPHSRTVRDRPAEGPVANAHDVDAGPQRDARLGTAARRGGRRDERRAASRSRCSRPARSCRRSACSTRPPKGTVEAFMGASYYWDAKDPAMQWFCSVPFGMNPGGMSAWYFHGEGLKLWEETYAAFNLVPRPGPATGPQMAGWFRKKINTHRRLQGAQDAHPRPRRAGGCQGRVARSC